MKLSEAIGGEISITSVRREMPDDPATMVVKINKNTYKYKDVLYDDVEKFRRMLNRGMGFKAFNWFKNKNYEYEKLS